MRSWSVLGSLLLAGAACAKAPGESRSLDRPEDVAVPVVATPAATPPGELGTEPAVGARRPPPPRPGPRAPLPPPLPAPDASTRPELRVPPAPVASTAAGAGITPPPPDGPRVPPAPVPGTAAAPEPNVPPGDTPVGLLEVPGMDRTPPNAPPPDPEPSAGPEILAGGAVTLNRFVICRDVRDREPVEPANSFPRDRDGQVWVYLDASNPGDQPQTVTVSFESIDRPGSAPPPVSLEVGPGPRYRTWARASTWRPAGTYRVVVRDAAGVPLARGTFRIVEL